MCSTATPITRPFQIATHLVNTRVNNGGLLGVLDGAAGRAGGLNGLDDVHGFLIGDLAENDVAAIEPAGLDSGDEELRAVAEGERRVSASMSKTRHVQTHVLGPALAMERRPGRVCFLVKFSSANFSP